MDLDLRAREKAISQPCIVKKFRREASAVSSIPGDLAIGNESESRYFRWRITLMKFSLSLFLLPALFISSCEDVDQPPSRSRRQAARYPAPASQQQQYPPQQQPFNPNAPPAPAPGTEAAAAPMPSAAPTKAAKGDHPYGIPVPGKPHVVESPFSPGKYVDVEGFPPGTEVKDPYTGKIFLVP